jgi:hypothetical protein
MSLPILLFEPQKTQRFELKNYFNPFKSNLIYDSALSAHSVVFIARQIINI